MFLVDENGRLIGGDMTTAMVAIALLEQHPGAAICYNLICSRSVPETIAAHGGRPVRTPVGHSLIKKIMRDEDAIFGGEHSGHFYFRDNWYADSGLIAMLTSGAALQGRQAALRGGRAARHPVPQRRDQPEGGGQARGHRTREEALCFGRARRPTSSTG